MPTEEDSDDELEDDADWVDPRKKLRWIDGVCIRLIRCYDLSALRCVRFLAQGQEPGKQKASALKAGLKMLGIIIYYGPFLFYLTHYYPTGEDGCLVATGST